MKHKLSLIAKERRKHAMALDEAVPPNVMHDYFKNENIDNATLPSIEQRIKNILHIVQQSKHPAQNMIFFVMYDISSTKVRTLVSKYLEEKGCSRIQRSVFLADLPAVQFETIKQDLVEVQAAYENKDSILIIPISTGYLDAMKIIGQDINFDLITHSRNTLFF